MVRDTRKGIIGVGNAILCFCIIVVIFECLSLFPLDRKEQKRIWNGWQVYIMKMFLFKHKQHHVHLSYKPKSLGEKLIILLEIIYLMECMLHQYSNVGYTSNNMKMRFSNNKSHVKRNATCEICAHLIIENHDINFMVLSWVEILRMIKLE